MKKKILLVSVLSVIGLVCVAAIVLIGLSISSKPSIEGNIKVGDYVTFGKYYDTPILWKCVSTDNGIMLVSEEILCLKAYDAAESGVWSEEGGSYTTNVNEQKYGSKVWATSNIREWLNSADNVVTYKTQPPIAEAVLSAENAYADEPGFLTNFTDKERGMLMPVAHEGCSDLVYILNYSEVTKYIGGAETRNGASIRMLTKKATENCIYDKSFGTSDDWWYYTRSEAKTDPDEKNLSTFGGGAFYYYYHVFYGVYPGSGSGGVLPVVNLNSDHCTSGDGTAKNPWVLG